MEKEKLKDTESEFRRWISGIPYELAFWKSYYANERRRKDLFSWSLYNKPCILDEFDIGQYIHDQGLESPKILDVGCALSYAFGNIINGKAENIIYVDPLAPFYNQILRKYKIDRPEITFGMIESLSSSFSKDSIDFIHVRNALDHCADPLEGITQCLAILKQDGVLYLNHFVNEAENEGYRGFHQFNISEKDGHLILWNKETHIDVTQYYVDVAEIKTTITDKGRIVAVIRKTGNLPLVLIDHEKISEHLSQMMMLTLQYFNSFSNSSSYQIKRLICNVGHRTMRLIPYSLLHKIKRIAGKV